MEKIITPFYKGMLLCLLFLGAHTEASAQNFPLTLPELPAGKSIRIYYRVNTNGTFSPVNATSISEQTTVTYSSGLQVSNDPATMMADDPTLTPAFAFDCTDFGSTVYVDSSASPGGDGTTWATAFNDLQAGLVVAELCPRVDSVLVAKGTYYPSTSDRNAFFKIPDSSVVLGGFPSGGSPLSDRMPTCNPTILSGDINMSGDSTGNAYHVVKTIEYQGHIIVDGFIIESGNTVADNDDGAGWWDGSSYAAGMLDISHVIFRNNIGVRGAAFYGEGLRKLNIINSVFEYNTATDRGGAVYFTPAMVLGPPVPIVLFENNLFHHNTATVNGGAIALTVTPGIDFSIINNTIADNSPDAFNNNSGGNVVVGNTIFWNNGPADITGAVVPSVTYSLVNNVVHPTNVSGDPLLSPAYRQGYASLLVIDKGSNAFSSQPTDLIGYPRINLSIIDLGAFELQTLYCVDSVVYINNDPFKWPVDSIYLGGLKPGTYIEVNGMDIDTIVLDCSNLGDTVLTLKVIDTTCGARTEEFICNNFTISVRDSTAPVVVCQDLTVQLLNAFGTATIRSKDLELSSGDNCGVVSWIASDTMFECMDVGSQIVSLTVRDASGNSAQCTSNVTVQDAKSPVVTCVNGRSYDILNTMPEPSITIPASDIEASPATDACGIDTIYLDKSTFTCQDLGTNIIRLIAVDVNGNTDYCETYVIINDPNTFCCDTPSITCPPDVTITADPFACEVQVSYADPTVMSICTPVITQLSGPASDSILDFGMYTVQFEASNAPTKKDTCSFTITVLENGQAQPLQSTAKRAAAGLACQDHVNISLSSDCQRVITAREVLVSGSAGCIDRYNCEVFKSGSIIPIPGATLTYEHVGQTLTYVVEDIQSGGKCWGTLKLEDKLGPVIRCENDTLTCLEAAIRSTDDYIESLVSDCGPYPARVEIVHSIWEDYQCEDSLFSGKITRTIRSTDPWGNHNECVQEIWIERNRLDSLICPDTIELECTTLEYLKAI
ncbi:MAG: HYR domain-containing protein, partial [Saprospiraceae bacterium]|nr:HYR domain-containing protein [Saprospiraceae bacterium]